MSDSLQPHELWHIRPPCPSPTPGSYSNSCSSSRWCHPAISSSVGPFSSCPQSLPASGSFPMSQLFTWGGQSTGTSASASVLPMNTQDWSPLGWLVGSPWSPRDSLYRLVKWRLEDCLPHRIIGKITQIHWGVCTWGPLINLIDTGLATVCSFSTLWKNPNELCGQPNIIMINLDFFFCTHLGNKKAQKTEFWLQCNE